MEIVDMMWREPVGDLITFPEGVNHLFDENWARRRFYKAALGVVRAARNDLYQTENVIVV